MDIFSNVPSSSASKGDKSGANDINDIFSGSNQPLAGGNVNSFDFLSGFYN